jgi:transcriptional regulator with XRE-family HTH domain
MAQKNTVKPRYRRVIDRVENKVKQKLLARFGTWDDIEEATGVGRGWISMWMRGNIAEPGVRKFYAVATYLGEKI